jgi:hypothetical protein
MDSSRLAEELNRRAERRRPSDDRGLPMLIATGDIDDWSRGRAVTRRRVLDEAAVGIALAFDSWILSFEVADEAMNDLWWIALSVDGQWSPLFYEIYEAFDAGEWSSDPEENPVATRTRPHVREILSRPEAALI